MRLDRSTFDGGGAAMAGIWLVFLAYPVITLANAPFSATAVGLGMAFVLAFAAVYVLGFGWSRELQRIPRYVGLLAWVGILLALVLVQIPLIGWMVYSYTTYLVASLVFTFPWKIAIPTSLALLLSCFSILLVGPPEYFWYVSGAVWLGPAIVGVVAWADRREKRTVRLERRAAVAEERESVARDVHDLLGHSLTVIALKSEVAAKLLETDPERARTELGDITRLSREALTEVRSTVTRLRHPDLPEQLVAARAALEAAGIQARLPAPEDVLGLPKARGSLYCWVLREAVTNVVRHSRASTCRVTIARDRLEVADDGVGVQAPRGNGVAGMERRAAEAGGRLDLGPWIPEAELLDGERPGTRLVLAFPEAPTDRERMVL